MVLGKHFANFVPRSSHRTDFLSITLFFYRGKVLIQFIALFLLIPGLFPCLVPLVLITHFSSPFLIWENLALEHHLFPSEVLVFSFPDGLNKKKRLNDLTWIHTVSHLPSAQSWQNERFSRGFLLHYTNLKITQLSAKLSWNRVANILNIVGQ